MTAVMERIDENTRVVLSDTDKIYINRMSNGFDLWTIKFETGVTHNSLSGSFTSPVFAFEAVKNYLETNKNRIKTAARNAKGA